MPLFDFKWELEGKAGGLGRVEADSIDEAKDSAKAIVVENRQQLTLEEIDNLNIEVTEVV